MVFEKVFFWGKTVGTVFFPSKTLILSHFRPTKGLCWGGVGKL